MTDGTAKQNPVVNGLRWVGVLPGSVACALLASFPIHLVVMLIQMLGTSRDGDIVSVSGKTPLAAIPSEMLEQFCYAFFNPLIVIIVGSIIAPKWKFPTGIALAILYGLFFGAFLTLEIAQGHMTGLRLVVTFILGAGGVTLGLLWVHKKSREPVPNKAIDGD